MAGMSCYNVRLQLTKPPCEFIAANTGWLAVFQLPTYAPDLNPLKQIQYRPDLVDGAGTGLIMDD
jgi:hypothetical protein